MSKDFKEVGGHPVDIWVKTIKAKGTPRLRPRGDVSEKCKEASIAISEEAKKRESRFKDRAVSIADP